MPRTLYLVLSGASSPEGMIDLVQALHGHDWRVTVLSTPTGIDFHDQERLAELTGEPVRVSFRKPGHGRSLPPADVVLACPLTFNSTNKFAQGLADNFAIALLCEMVGYGVPTVVVPHCKPQLASHPAFVRSLETLRGIESVTVLHDPDAPYENRLPSWQQVIDTVNSL
ncbi:flavoprotein [Nocardiopsis alba]|uniref:flavoprotein n=1 Tax=Nocardiopsis alba TaxID=53437 RepID=UPI0033BBFBF6